MANWYNGVLKYVELTRFSQLLIVPSTGKKRYGHPALTGLLPQPWLPLKKGETLVNTHNTNRPGRKSDQAVVLSLRKRYSVVRRGGRTSTTGASAPSIGIPVQDNGQNPTDSSGALSGDMTNNPWQESIAGPSSPSQAQHTVNHRLSYDFGSGVIILPEDGIWLEGMDSDSDDDYGSGDISGSQVLPDSAVSDDGQGVTAGSDVENVEGSSRTRYGTYFHHPERRWQSVPGAFPSGS
jgi:calcium permeable stress-gated cation channel